MLVQGKGSHCLSKMPFGSILIIKIENHNL
ncbi:hypothetical protein SAMN04490182_1545 [Pseudomonas cedrina]|uniref:Uncharacterized protein n=1 Tax=Pseudomonas cedrina TaxID=651740 RepID=A0ABY0UCS8_PSECE|nr:hypothetical protein SAMN04490182_1545 [Pseudomonas cedrina]